MSGGRRIHYTLHALLWLFVGAAAHAADTRAEAVFLDHGTLKLAIEQQSVGLVTPYGTLSIPLADVQRIEFAARVPEDLAPKIDRAIADLGNESYPTREAASAELVKHAHYSLPALQKAVKSKDTEIAARAEEVLGRLRNDLPEDLLNLPEFDTIHTEQSKFIGHIEGTGSWRATTTQFGEVSLRLADLRSVKFARDIDLASAAPDPGHLIHLNQHLGKTFVFKVTGNKNGQVWGSDLYTADSALCAAAVHAGLLQPGQTGVVRVRMMGVQAAFQGVTKNGVTSMAYGTCPSFEFVR